MFVEVGFVFVPAAGAAPGGLGEGDGGVIPGAVLTIGTSGSACGEIPPVAAEPGAGVATKAGAPEVEALVQGASPAAEGGPAGWEPLTVDVPPVFGPEDPDSVLPETTVRREAPGA